MNEMIERTVKTLRDIDLTVGTPNYYQVTRAIIESMREPTDADFNGKFGQSSRELFTEMLDELLK